MPMYDFLCDCGEKFEALVKMDVKQEPCPSCGRFAKRLVSCPQIQLDGTDPGYPSAWDKWVKKRDQKMKQERASEE